MPEGLGYIAEGCRKDASFWTFDMVQERLVEAYIFLGRLPDREAGWLRASTMSIWREVKREEGDHIDPEEAPRLRGLNRAEVDRMEEALAWLLWVKPEAVAVIRKAVRALERGDKRVPWGSLIPDPRVSGAADRLRMTYNRAITRIANMLNTAFEPR